MRSTRFFPVINLWFFSGCEVSRAWGLTLTFASWHGRSHWLRIDEPSIFFSGGVIPSNLPTVMATGAFLFTTDDFVSMDVAAP